jgi:hypothetical protein
MPNRVIRLPVRSALDRVAPAGVLGPHRIVRERRRIGRCGAGIAHSPVLEREDSIPGLVMARLPLRVRAGCGFESKGWDGLQPTAPPAGPQSEASPARGAHGHACDPLCRSSAKASCAGSVPSVRPRVNPLAADESQGNGVPRSRLQSTTAARLAIRHLPDFAPSRPSSAPRPCGGQVSTAFDVFVCCARSDQRGARLQQVLCPRRRRRHGGLVRRLRPELACAWSAQLPWAFQAFRRRTRDVGRAGATKHCFSGTASPSRPD